MHRPHGRHRVGAEISQPRGTEARADAKCLDPVRPEFMCPVEHQHAQRRLAAPVPDGLEVDRLRPARGLCGRREVRLGGLRHM